MIDELFFKEGLERHKIDYVFFGFVMTVLGFLFTIGLFGIQSSAAQILAISLLLTPAIVKLLRKEEMLVRREGLRHVYRNHKNIFEIYLFIFIGAFFAFFIIQLVLLNFGNSFSQAFDFQVKYIQSDQQLSYGLIDYFQGVEGASAFMPWLKLVGKSVLLVTLAFALSFFYGAGGVFFIVASAGIFSTLVIFAMKSTEFWYFSVFFLVFFFILLLPIIMSSVAGGIISRAFVHEKIRNKYMKNVLKDGTYIFLLSLCAAFVLSVLWYLGVFIFGIIAL